MDRFAPAAARLVEAMTDAAEPGRSVAFQGAPGAYSHQAVRELFPAAPPLPCSSFEAATDAVREGRAAAAVIPVENSLHGRVADVHFLLPESGLAITGEHHVRVRHCLLGVPGATLAGVRVAVSHPQALGQCRHRLRQWGIVPEAYADTAGAAASVAAGGDRARAAVASKLAAELYGCAVLADGIEDEAHNATRFLVLEREPRAVLTGIATKTTLGFEVQSVPAALFKALGGFATNGVNLTKLESYLREGAFTAAEFLVDIEGRPEDEPVARALDELQFFTKWVRIHGTYPRAAVSVPT